MSAINQTSVPLVGVGGTPPYAFTVIQGANTTISASITGSTLTVDATSLEPGNFTVEIQITDQTETNSTSIVTVQVLDAADFAILNQDITIEPTVFPSAQTVPLVSTGGTGAITWSIVPSVTTLPGATISGSTLSFSLTSFGSNTVGIRATDSLGHTIVTVIEVTVQTSTVVSVVGGDVLLSVEPTTAEIGAHQFTVTVIDSSATTAQTTFNYTIEEEISAIDVDTSIIDHFWGAGDTTTIALPITGELTGFSIGPLPPTVAANGITASIDTSTNTLLVTGPPTSFSNAQIEFPIPIVQGTTQVATIMREFTLVSHNSSGASLGTMTCFPVPYIVGQAIGLNPERPFFNSPSIFLASGLTVQLATGNTLPLGLSLDSVTGLIYGTVLAANVPTSVLNYVDSTNTVQGTITIQWNIVTSQFQLIDMLPAGQIQAAYSGIIGTSSSAPLTGATVFSGTLPFGLNFGVSGSQVTVTGTPTQAGFFDLWIKVTNSNQQAAFIQKRFVVDYIAPLALVTSALQTVFSNTPFTQTLAAVGGTSPYTWSVPTGTLPTGITLNPNSGVLSGTTTLTSFSQTIVIQVTDTRGVSVSQSFLFAINNTLIVTTTVLPLILPGQFYQFQLTANGGTPPFSWSLSAGSSALPGGFTLSTSGLLSGSTASLQSFSENITVQVTDSANSTATQALQLAIGTTSGLTIDTEGIGPITRGLAYQGNTSVLGNGKAPFFWSVTPNSPNPLPTGLTFGGDQSDNGTTATLSGTISTDLLNLTVEIQVLDSNGNSAFAFLFLSTVSSLAITTTSPLPQATVSGEYSVQLVASGVNTPFTWSLDPSSPALTPGLALSGAGVLTGPTTAAATTTIVPRVTDTLGDFATKSLAFTSVVSTLAITTASLPVATAGVAYSTTLTATGGNPPFAWSISPDSANLLPAGLSISASTGVISGTTLAATFNAPITVRVTDSLGVIKEATFTLQVLSGLKLFTGPDFVAGTGLALVDATTLATLGGIGHITVGGTPTNSLGIVAQGNVSSIIPRPNLSFDIIAINVVSTSAAQIALAPPPGFTASVLLIASGVAIISLSGPFGSFGGGTNNFAFALADSGVQGSTTFTWEVVAPTAISIVQDSGAALPQNFN
jgi:hypothetical protein